MIIPLGKRKYALVSKEGKILGEHPSIAAAKRQERAIVLSKLRARRSVMRG